MLMDKYFNVKNMTDFKKRGIWLNKPNKLNRKQEQPGDDFAVMTFFSWIISMIATIIIWGRNTVFYE